MRAHVSILILLLMSPLLLLSKTFELSEDFVVSEGLEYIDFYLSTDTAKNPEERYFQMRNNRFSDANKYLFFTTQSQKWMLFDVKNIQDQPFDLLIEMGNLGINQAEYYVFHADTILYEGKVMTQSGQKTSAYYDRNIVIPFTAAPHTEYAFLIKVSTNAPILDLPVIVWKKSEKFSISQGIELGRGLFYGVLLFYIVVTGMVVFLIRSRSNIYFWLYIFLGGVLLLLRSGIPFEVFWPGSSYFDFILSSAVLYIYMLVTLRFLKFYLSSKIQKGWYTTSLDIAFTIGCVLLVLYLPFTYLNVFVQDTLLIVQMVYINVTNVLVIFLLFWTLPKIEDKFVLIISLLYFFLFSIYLFNPFLGFGFWAGELGGHILLYSGGFLIAVILFTITSLRMKSVIRKNQQIKYELRNLHKIYSHSLIQGQEKQRRKVAEELHDGIGAHLSAIKMKLSGIKSSLVDENEISMLEKIIENLDEGTHQVREMSHELMPPTLNRYGLKASINDMMKKYQKTYPIHLNFKSNLKGINLDTNSESILYRLIHQLFEALVHGWTKKADIKLIILPSVMTATIQVKYSGGDPIAKSESVGFKDLQALVNILQGKFEFFMSNLWDDELIIEIPIQLDEKYLNHEK